MPSTTKETGPEEMQQEGSRLDLFIGRDCPRGRLVSGHGIVVKIK